MRRGNVQPDCLVCRAAFYKQPHLGMEAKDPENTAQAKPSEHVFLY